MQDPLDLRNIERLRREAKAASRREGITHTQALDREAVKRGHPNWAVMQHGLTSVPARFPIFNRSLEDMRLTYRKVNALDGMRASEQRLRMGMPNLSRRFANPVSALEYARDYLELALSLPRVRPHAQSVAAVEMRVLLPYTLHRVSGQDRFIILGRDYKPLGMANRDEHVDYELYKNLHVCISADELRQATRHPDYAEGYLYSLPPSYGKPAARAVLKQLNTILELAKRYERPSPG